MIAPPTATVPLNPPANALAMIPTGPSTARVLAARLPGPENAAAGGIAWTARACATLGGKGWTVLPQTAPQTALAKERVWIASTLLNAIAKKDMLAMIVLRWVCYIIVRDSIVYTLGITS